MTNAMIFQLLDALAATSADPPWPEEAVCDRTPANFGAVTTATIKTILPNCFGP